MRITQMLVVVSMVVTLGAGCVSSRSGKVYSRRDAQQSHVVELGIVESVNQVNIEGTRTPLGTIAGGVAGGALGSRVGSGRDAQVIGTVLGALVGAATGAFAEEGLTRRKGLEITVKLDAGTILAVVQEADEDFFPGDRVRILTGPSGTKRVRH